MFESVFLFSAKSQPIADQLTVSTISTISTINKTKHSEAPKRVHISLAGSWQPLNEFQVDERQLRQLLLDEEPGAAAADDDKVVAVGPTLRCHTSGGAGDQSSLEEHDTKTQYKWTFSR